MSLNNCFEMKRIIFQPNVSKMTHKNITNVDAKGEAAATR